MNCDGINGLEDMRDTSLLDVYNDFTQNVTPNDIRLFKSASKTDKFTSLLGDVIGIKELIAFTENEIIINQFVSVWTIDYYFANKNKNDDGIILCLKYDKNLPFIPGINKNRRCHKIENAELILRRGLSFKKIIHNMETNNSLIFDLRIVGLNIGNLSELLES